MYRILRCSPTFSTVDSLFLRLLSLLSTAVSNPSFPPYMWYSNISGSALPTSPSPIYSSPSATLNSFLFFFPPLFFLLYIYSLNLPRGVFPSAIWPGFYAVHFSAFFYSSLTIPLSCAVVTLLWLPQDSGRHPATTPLFFHPQLFSPPPRPSYYPGYSW